MQLRILQSLLQSWRSQWWSPVQIRAHREAALVRTMRHAVEHVPYYRELGIDVRDLRSADDLLRFPLLTKRIIQEQGSRLLAEGFDPASLHSSRTSGSTGEPTLTYFDSEAWALTKYALKMRRIAAVAPVLFRRCLIVSEQRPEEAQRYAQSRPFGGGLLYRERVVSLFDSLQSHVDAIDEFKPDMLYAFPSYLAELMRTYAELGRKVPRIPWLFTSSEVLSARLRERAESAFRGRIHDIYGNTEFKEVAWQCAHGRYHINVESVDVQVEASTVGAPGNVVLTTLCNRAMPLLRFSTGDLALPGSAEPCPCGRALPTLQVLAGREGDVVELPDGRRLSVYLLTTSIEMLPGLHQYRINRLASHRLQIEIVSDAEVAPDTLQRCHRELSELLGSSMSIDFVRRPRLERIQGWKHKILVTSAE